MDSPYNTRTRRGLPPGPIGSPGMAAIKAAANPARTKYLFYVVKPGTCGRHAFSRTDAEFQRDVQALQQRPRAPRRQVPHQLLMAPTLLGVAGFPVAHSRSPAMHAAALEALGLDWRYLRLPLPPERFAETARALGGSGYGAST